jgi:hypothetical protein
VLCARRRHSKAGDILTSRQGQPSPTMFVRREPDNKKDAYSIQVRLKQESDVQILMKFWITKAYLGRLLSL